MHDVSFLLVFGLITLALFVGGYIGKLLKFPAIVFYILIGIIAGQIGEYQEAFHIFSEIGIVLLFFYLGLEFNFQRAVQTAQRIWHIGLLDFFFNFVVIFGVFLILGFDLFTSLLAGGVAYASSSAITTKIIVDNHRQVFPETEIILGLMVFEDIIAPVILALLSAIHVSGSIDPTSVGIIFVKILVVFIAVFLFAKFVKEKLASFIDDILKEDIFILFALGFVVLFAGITQFIGLSEALGAFLLGVIIAESGKEEELEKALYSIRDWAVAMFFFIFGTSINFATVSFDKKLLVAILIIVSLSILGKFLTGYIGGRLAGLPKRAALITGFSIINRGEFSVVMGKFAKSEYIPFIGVYILIMSFIGIIFAQYAPHIAKKIVPPKKTKTKKRRKKKKYQYYQSQKINLEDEHIT
ncbi:MAG: cation:proton antiporter [Aquificae bacterium]|nr:cation:proton antiporter [Aquificota bacterium]